MVNSWWKTMNRDNVMDRATSFVHKYLTLKCNFHKKNHRISNRAAVLIQWIIFRNTRRFVYSKMIAAFSQIQPHLKFKSKLINIDNLGFKFHYRATFLILLVCTILVTSRWVKNNNFVWKTHIIILYQIYLFCYFMAFNSLTWFCHTSSRFQTSY